MRGGSYSIIFFPLATGHSSSQDIEISEISMSDNDDDDDEANEGDDIDMSEGCESAESEDLSEGNGDVGSNVYLFLDHR